MPIGTLNWELRDHGSELGNDRGWVLTLLYLHSNPRGRCWPGMDRIAANSGCALAKADGIIDWLVARGAIIKVPYAKRELEEKKLHQRKTVYQLTGIIKLETGWLSYLKIDQPEHINTLVALVKNVIDASPVKDSIIKILNTKYLIIKDSISESEGNTSFEGNTDSKGDNRFIKSNPLWYSRVVTPILRQLLSACPDDPPEEKNKSVQLLKAAGVAEGVAKGFADLPEQTVRELIAAATAKERDGKLQKTLQAYLVGSLQQKQIEIAAQAKLETNGNGNGASKYELSPKPSEQEYLARFWDEIAEGYLVGALNQIQCLGTQHHAAYATEWEAIVGEAIRGDRQRLDELIKQNAPTQPGHLEPVGQPTGPIESVSQK